MRTGSATAHRGSSAAKATGTSASFPGATGPTAESTAVKGSKHKACVPVLTVGLTTERGREQVHVPRHQAVYAHMPRLGGTCSTAREKPARQHLVGQGAPTPPPPRSDECLQGLLASCGVGRVKANKANAVAGLCPEVCMSAFHCRRDSPQKISPNLRFGFPLAWRILRARTRYPQSLPGSLVRPQAEQ